MLNHKHRKNCNDEALNATNTVLILERLLITFALFSPKCYTCRILLHCSVRMHFSSPLKLNCVTIDNVTEFQAGLQGKRTTDHIKVLKTNIEYDKYRQRNTYLQFYNVVKCFDKLCLKDVMSD